MELELKIDEVMEVWLSCGRLSLRWRMMGEM